MAYLEFTSYLISIRYKISGMCLVEVQNIRVANF